MSEQTAVKIDTKTLWGGQISPFSTSYGKLMMWFFLVSDALTFGGLLTAYGFTRHDSVGAWPIGEETFEALPGLGNGFPLVYVALMTFILIVSSVTMVLAVEAGHRMDRKGVTKWMLATIIGGFFFVGSQAWEWSHFIHGSEFGRVELADGSLAIVKGEFGEIESMTVVKAGTHHTAGHASHKVGHKIVESQSDMMHELTHAIEGGHYKNGVIHMHDGSEVKVNRKADNFNRLIIKKAGKKYKLNQVIEKKDAEKLYWESVNKGEAGKVVYGANLNRNEYGPQQYGQFFFFITGFHGFHVFSGVVINIIIFAGVIKGTYHKRGHYEMVEKTGLYWHFVDLVWVFVFTFFYLV